MNTFLLILTVIAFLLEVVILAFIEHQLWKTVYTPLNVLMLPTAVVMLLSIIAVSCSHLYPIHPCTIWIWMGGLLIFAIPSWISSIGASSVLSSRSTITIDDSAWPQPKKFLYVTIPLALLILYHILSTISISARNVVLGSDELAESALGSGLWAHLFVILLVLEIICFYYVGKRHWYMLIPLALCILISILNQVKGWVLIPIFAGIMVLVYSNIIHITWKKILAICIVGIVFFCFSYYFSIVIAEGKNADYHLWHFIEYIFLHYLTSGILGMNMDIDLGILEAADPAYLFTPLVNICHLVTGDAMLSNLNTSYLSPSWGSLTNVRSFMGTIYVFARGYAPFIVLLWSSVAYIIQLAYMYYRSLTLLLIHAWMSAILLMGWFDYYFALLKPIEILVLLALLGIALRLHHRYEPVME